MTHRHTRRAGRAVAIVLAVATTACASSTPGSPGRSSPARGYPVTISSCGQPVTFDGPPRRAVSNDISLTEDMLALGLAPQMVGVFGVSDPLPAEYRALARTVPSISMSYVTLEPLIGLRPDFLFAGWDYGLTEAKNLTPTTLAQHGIKTYVLEESCAHVQPGKRAVSISDTYTDLRNLGAIFGVSDRATQIVNLMQAQVVAIQRRVGGLPPASVFLYDSGEPSPFTAPGLALPNDLIARAGGVNVFGDVKQTWTSVSWEQVVARQPACVVINDYGTPTWQQKQQFLQTFPLAKNLPAIRNNCILHLTYDQLTPGPRNADAITALARWLHPTAFGSGT